MPFYPTRCRHSQAKNKSWAGSSGFWFTGQVAAATVTSLGSDLRNEIEDASSRRVRGLSLRDRLRSSEQSCCYATSKGCSLGYSASDKDETPICETTFCRDDVSLLAFQNSNQPLELFCPVSSLHPNRLQRMATSPWAWIRQRFFLPTFTKSVLIWGFVSIIVGSLPYNRKLCKEQKTTEDIQGLQKESDHLKDKIKVLETLKHTQTFHFRVNNTF